MDVRIQAETAEIHLSTQAVAVYLSPRCVHISMESVWILTSASKGSVMTTGPPSSTQLSRMETASAMLPG